MMKIFITLIFDFINWNHLGGFMRVAYCFNSPWWNIWDIFAVLLIVWNSIFCLLYQICCNSWESVQDLFKLSIFVLCDRSQSLQSQNPTKILLQIELKPCQMYSFNFHSENTINWHPIPSKSSQTFLQNTQNFNQIRKKVYQKKILFFYPKKKLNFPWNFLFQTAKNKKTNCPQ